MYFKNKKIIFNHNNQRSREFGPAFHLHADDKY